MKEPYRISQKRVLSNMSNQRLYMFIWMRATRCTTDVVDSRLHCRSTSCSQALPKGVAQLFIIASGLEVHGVRYRITAYPKFSEYHLRSLITTYRWTYDEAEASERKIKEKNQSVSIQIELSVLDWYWDSVGRQRLKLLRSSSQAH